MLELAYLYKEKLERELLIALQKKENKFYNNANWIEYELKIETSNWNKLQYVSIYKNELNGYLSCDIERGNNIVSNVSIIRFKQGIIFSLDFVNFLKSLFDVYQFNKIKWSVVDGNPSKILYEKIINGYGGRRVGYFKNDVRLIDGKYYDMILYEILKEDYGKKEVNKHGIFK